jgi:RNA polymerase sigma-70 factor (ECF subfamily)
MTLRSTKVAPIREIPPLAAPEMTAVIRVILGRDHPDVTDVTQESLLALRDALVSFRRESDLMQYAKQVAVRTALSSRRRSRARNKQLALTQRNPEGASHQAVARARRLAAFRGLLDELPEPQAEAFALRVVLDYSLPQVAEATGASLSAVRSRIRIATEKLKHRIKAGPTLRELLKERA